MATPAIPVIDFGSFDSDPNEVAQKMLEACKTIGFFYIVNHGLARNEIEHAFDLVRVCQCRKKTQFLFRLLKRTDPFT